MMKTIYCTIIILLLSLSGIAQSMSTKRAEKFFYRRNYDKAIELYEQSKKDQNALQNLADAYIFTFENEKAVETYKKLFEDYEDVHPFYLFKYAHALKGTGDYQKADEIMQKVHNIEINTLKNFKEIDRTAPFAYEIKKLEENSSYSDFGAAFLDNKVVFASGRSAKSPEYVWNNEPYLDLYVADLTSESEFENIQPFSEAINLKKHESSATFNSDGTIMYFDRTRKDKVRIEGQKVAHIEIFKAEKINGEWTNIEKLPFSSEKYSTEHPFLNKTGDKLYFSSDMSGSLGAFDIYVVDVHPDGSFGEPQNLGSTINTPYRDQFPFITEDNTLYFASTGHPENLGGLDIYYSEMKNGAFSKPKNMGSTINSNLDDFAFVLSEEGNRGFFTSNRGDKIDNIYSFTKTAQHVEYLVEGVILDEQTEEPLANASIEIVDDTGTIVAEINADEEARFTHTLEPNTAYTIKATSPLYHSKEVKFTTQDPKLYNQYFEIKLKQYPYQDKRITENEDGRLQIDLENIYFDFDKDAITERAKPVLNELVQILETYPEMEIEITSHTDVRGSDAYNMNLSERRAASTLKYLVKKGIDVRRLRSAGYGKTQLLNACTTEAACTDVEHQKNRRSEFTILK